MKNFIAVIIFSTFLFPINAIAECVTNSKGQVVCGGGQCKKDQYGEVYCAESGGGALLNSKGKVECGVGRCALDSKKNVWCSKQINGGAAIDSYGKVKCIGGCAPGSASLCQKAEVAK